MIVMVASTLGATETVLATTSRSSGPASSVDAVLAWNANAGEAALAACIAPTDNPLHESRMYAMTHIAIHDALNAIDRRYRPYAFVGHASRRASTDAAVAAAAHDVLVPVLGQIPAPFPPACIDAAIASVEADYAAALAAIPDRPAKRKGINVEQGPPRRSSRSAPTTARTRRCWTSTTRRAPSPASTGSRPGPRSRSRRAGATSPPSCCDDSSQFRADPPYAVTESAYTADFDEVKRLGGDGITTPSDRTAEQTEIALFWVESSPLQWNRIARTVSADAGLDLWEQARLFGLLNMALADGYIGIVRDQVPLQLLAARHGDPARRDRRQPGHASPTRPGPRWWRPLRSRTTTRRTASREVRRHRCSKRFFGTDQISFETCSLTLPAGSTCNDARPGAALVHELLPGGRRERALSHPRRVPLPARGGAASNTAARSATVP